jgi:D-alanine-D-alanine ligase
MPKTSGVPRGTGMKAKDSRVRLGIVFGGKSGEHEVSLKSAASVISALNPNEFEISVIGITKSGKLASQSELREMLPAQLHNGVHLQCALESSSSGMRLVRHLSEDHRESYRLPKIIFPLLHGPFGEDGTFQGLLEMLGLPYVGCGVVASSVGMDKDVMKRLFIQAGLPVPPFRTVLSREVAKTMDSLKRSLTQELGYPMFSKPANLGSSVGVCKIHSESEFEKAVKYSAQFDRKILIEQGIDAREIECAILGNDDAQASVVGEIVSAHEYYDYDAKYVSAASRLEIPAHVDEHKSDEIRDLALRSFNAIDGAGLARVDFFLEKNTNKVWINEINTMPGFTPISMYAKLWAATGVPFEDLVRRLVQLGEERYREKSEFRVS